MNQAIQLILVSMAVGLSVLYLLRKYFWKPAKNSGKGCGSGCDC